MIGEKIPEYLYVFFGIYIVLLLAVAFFINRYIIRKKSNIFINILCVFLWYTIFLMIIFFPLDLFSDFLFDDTEQQKKNKKIFSAILYWNFYLFGFIIVDQIKNYITDGHFKIKWKILSIIKKTAIFLLIFVGLGFVLKGILQLFSLVFDDSNFLIITIKILQTLVAIPMLIAYLMFLGCSLGDMPRDLYVKYNYPLRAKKLCWSMTHVNRKYKKETEFLILSINKIKMTQDLIKQKQLEEINKEISDIKDKMKNEENKEEKKNIKNEYDNIVGLRELMNCENEMNLMLNKLEQTVKDFNLDISLDSIDNEEEKRPLKNPKELVAINEAHYIYKTQLFRINYQKYSIYKEWTEIRSFMLDYKNKDISRNKNSILDLKDESINNFGVNDEINNTAESLINDDKPTKFQKAILSKYKTIYYKIMPIISIILIVFCIMYGILMIIGQLEYTFKWDLICGKIFRAWFTNAVIITPIRVFPIVFTLFAICYSFASIKSDMVSCIYGQRQTEPCHALFFVGMIAKFICPMCYTLTKITYIGVKLDPNKSKIIAYFNEQFGYLETDNIVVLVSKIAVLALFLKAIILNITGCYGTYAHKKYKYLSYNARYIEKELEIEEGDNILCDMNKIYGCNFEKIKEDFIIE
jgi:ABC-type multidrug transport system fused ATPase/permease subunit